MKDKSSSKPLPRILGVKAARRITKNMIRITLAGPEIADIPAGCEGANCKVFLPQPGQSEPAFRAQFADGPRPDVRTYTVRHIRPGDCEMDIDFVDHGDEGPASAWARRAQPGDFCGFAGPGPVKVERFYADWYLLIADMSAIPVVAATLEAMPKDAKGIAFFEVPSLEDRQDIDAPKGIVQHWLLHADSHTPSTQIIDAVQALDWPSGQAQTCIAGESGVIKELRQLLHVDHAIAREHTYISGYWKMGLIEDEHQKLKRKEQSATA